MITKVFVGLFSLAIYGPFATSANTAAAVTAASTINANVAPFSNAIDIVNKNSSTSSNNSSNIYNRVDCNERSVVATSSDVVCCSVLW